MRYNYLRSNSPLAKKIDALARSGAFNKVNADAPVVTPITDPIPFIPRLKKPPMKRSRRIFNAALEYFGMPENVMCGPSRTKDITFARQLSMYVVYSETAGMESTPSVGKMFGGRDHTTVVHSVQKMREAYESGDARVVAAVNFLRVIP